ncbi:hypothetical protein BC940DRAFT_312968 [Gongronella butleri]|nr:hypothetical protein BC940DRAFT_312968 [Gongronella butleri]
MTDRSKRLLPPWLLRLLGLTSIATLLVAIYFAVTRSRKSIGSRGDSSSSSQVNFFFFTVSFCLTFFSLDSPLRPMAKRRQK